MQDEHPHKVIPFLAAALTAMALMAVVSTGEPTWSALWKGVEQGNREFVAFTAWAIPGQDDSVAAGRVAGASTSVEGVEYMWTAPWQPFYDWLKGE